MNIYIIYGAFAFSMLFFIVFAFLSYRRKDDIGRSLARAIQVSFFIIASYIVLFILKNPLATDICMSIIKILIAWDLYFSVRFVDYYTQTPDKPYVIGAIRLALILDSVLFISNPINKLMMDASFYMEGNRIYLGVTPNYFYPYHLALVMILGIYAVVILAIKARHSSEVVRFRYTLLIHESIIIYILETWFVLDNRLPMDYTVFLYVIMIAFGYFLSYSYIPRKLLRAIMDVIDSNIADATIIYDEKGNVLRINKTAEEKLAKENYCNLQAVSDFVGDVTDGEHQLEIGNSIFVIFVHHLYDKKNNLIAAIFIFRDITENIKIQEHRHKVAITDHLTGALNRGGFFEKAIKSMKENSEDEVYALLIGGIVDFKEINSTYGTRIGDELLLEIAKKMENFSKKVPMVYGRTAEGKFACLIKAEYVDEVRRTFKSYELVINSSMTVTAGLNFGMIIMDDSSKSLDYYYERALLALSEAKRDATTNFIEYTQQMEDYAAKKLLMTSEMSKSLQAEDFYLVLQPQIDLTSRKVVGAEALVRWNHPTLGLVSPGDFIPLFEANGFISCLDEYVWNKAADLAVTLKKEGIFDGTISVNVSQVDITAIDVTETFEKVIERSGVEKERIHLEITESACANNIEALIETMNKLRSRGFILEIDDFGSGYSSLNVLKNLPFDIIKLDMEFMRNERESSRDEIIIDSIAKMIHSMDGKIIVEGIETSENFERTLRLGGDVGQGYYFAKPLSIDDFCTFVKEHKAL